MDIDHFKKVNDIHGHLAGDMVLHEMGKILTTGFRESDTVCRYGGEEFAIILHGASLEESLMLCERFRKIVAQHDFLYENTVFQICISIGVAAYGSSPDESYTDLIKIADAALYQAKAEGRNRTVASGFRSLQK